jgi:hypothetical protein
MIDLLQWAQDVGQQTVLTGDYSLVIATNKRRLEMKKLIPSLIVLSLFALPVTPANALFGLPKTFRGQVQNVEQNSITIVQLKEDQRKEMIFEVNPETKLEEIASLDNIQAGDEVKVQYKQEEGSNIAVSIAKVEQEDASLDTTL